MAIPLCIFVGLCTMLSIVSGEHLPEECKIIFAPTSGHTSEPTPAPTDSPTLGPTDRPTNEPTNELTASVARKKGRKKEKTRKTRSISKHTPSPTDFPTSNPTPGPTNEPTDSPTSGPTSEPTNEPTDSPTLGHTSEPTPAPTDSPTSGPTSEPTDEPTDRPTSGPTSGPTSAPAIEPTAPTDEPTETPTSEPAIEPLSGQQNGWKWNLIHPEYNGTYGEILWQVYCGDLRSNHRFDNFRKKKLWDVKVIEDELLPYFQVNDETKNAEKSQAVIGDIRNGSSSSKHYGLWVFLLCLFGLVFIGYFAYKAKYKEMHMTEMDECEPLLNLDTIRYDC